MTTTSFVPQEPAAPHDIDPVVLIDEKAEYSPPEPELASAFANLTKVQAVKYFWKATGLCFLAGLCVFMEGYQAQITGNAVSNTGFIDQFGTMQPSGKLALDAKYVSAWGGTSGAFQLLGQHFSTFLADKYGRRVSFLVASVLIVIGVLIEMFVTTIGGWLGAKVVTGFAAGMGQATSLIVLMVADVTSWADLQYIAEIAPTRIRGSLLCCYGLFNGLGQLTSAIALQVVNVTNPLNWRRAIYSEWVPVGLFILGLPFIVESPWYYARKKDDARAMLAMQRLYGTAAGYDVEREYHIIKVELEREQSRRISDNASTYREIFTGTNLRRTIASFFGVVILQWSGASVVFSYATYFLQQAGIDQPFQATCIVYTLLVFMIIVSFYLTERFGRRTLLLIGASGCFVCNIIIGTLGVVGRTQTVLHATLAVICIWVLFYSGCMAGVSWGLTTEIATPRLRARTAAVVINGSQCFSLMFGYTVPLMLSATGSGARNWGVKTLYLFACLGGTGLVINWFTLPEVAGRTYAELDEMFEARIPPRKMKRYLTNAQKTARGIAGA